MIKLNRVAVITPYFKESTDILRQCYESVRNQAVACDHFFVSDGFPNLELMKWDIKHISLSQAHADNGNTPRGIGSILADSEGYDFISYLDADNWFHENHLQSLLNVWQETKADVCASFRTFHQFNGDLLPIEEPDEQSLEHIDTSCLLLHRNAFDCLNIWLKMPKALSPICDRVFVSGLRKRKYKFEYTKQKTLAFRSQYIYHYNLANLEPPPNSKTNVMPAPYQWLQTIEGINETVSRLGFYPL